MSEGDHTRRLISTAAVLAFVDLVVLVVSLVVIVVATDGDSWLAWVGVLLALAYTNGLVLAYSPVTRPAGEGILLGSSVATGLLVVTFLILLTQIGS